MWRSVLAFVAAGQLAERSLGVREEESQFGKLGADVEKLQNEAVCQGHRIRRETGKAAVLGEGVTGKVFGAKKYKKNDDNSFEKGEYALKTPVKAGAVNDMKEEIQMLNEIKVFSCEGLLNIEDDKPCEQHGNEWKFTENSYIMKKTTKTLHTWLYGSSQVDSRSKGFKGNPDLGKCKIQFAETLAKALDCLHAGGSAEKRSVLVNQNGQQTQVSARVDRGYIHSDLHLKNMYVTSKGSHTSQAKGCQWDVVVADFSHAVQIGTLMDRRQFKQEYSQIPPDAYLGMDGLYTPRVATKYLARAEADWYAFHKVMDALQLTETQITTIVQKYVPQSTVSQLAEDKFMQHVSGEK